jgi:hypothetical protein
LPIHLKGVDIAPQDEEGHVTVGAKIPEGNSLKEWLHPELNDFAVAPKKEFLMKFTVDVPTTAHLRVAYTHVMTAALGRLLAWRPDESADLLFRSRGE